MNIFVLDLDPNKAARYHCDKHVVKMVLETAEILSAAICMLLDSYHYATTKNGRKIKKYDNHKCQDVYGATHIWHPCVKWVMKSRANFDWLLKLGRALTKEYTYRYGRVHKSAEIIENSEKYRYLFPKGKLTSFAQAMPVTYKSEDSVEAYRNYYIGEKLRFCRYKRRRFPFWLK